MNILLLEAHEIDRDGAATLAGPRARHLQDVLGVTPGAEVRVGVVDGPTGVATVVASNISGVSVRCVFEGSTPERPPVDLLLALPRPKVMRRLWPQLAALGVGQIILTNAARVERHYFDAHVLEPPRYRSLLLEGLQQARDTRVPLVSIHRRFKVLVEDDLDALFHGGLRLAAQPGLPPDGHAVPACAPGERVLVAVGPEGGWSAFELDLLKSRRFRALTLGPRVLRTDTACVALLALVHDAVRAGQHA